MTQPITQPGCTLKTKKTFHHPAMFSPLPPFDPSILYPIPSKPLQATQINTKKSLSAPPSPPASPRSPSPSSSSSSNRGDACETRRPEASTCPSHDHLAPPRRPPQVNFSSPFDDFTWDSCPPSPRIPASQGGSGGGSFQLFGPIPRVLFGLGDTRRSGAWHDKGRSSKVGGHKDEENESPSWIGDLAMNGSDNPWGSDSEDESDDEVDDLLEEDPTVLDTCEWVSQDGHTLVRKESRLYWEGIGSQPDTPRMTLPRL
ncbi:hypothetical protein T439DRAFT_323624 [Meredithblackwellia eburnea MCA 4105]